ncbi:hypothetical protein GEMRC1_004805 [Eukaryota sp. GEM-RC1]
MTSSNVTTHSHEQIVHYTPYVCKVENNIFDVYVIIGNQSSNVFQLKLTSPRHGLFPLVLSPSGNYFRIFGPNFGKMYECFVNSTIQMSGYEAELITVTTDELVISTGILVGLRRFTTHIEFTTGISLVLSVPITSLEALNTTYVCFVNQLCVIEVYSLYGEVSMNDFQITPTIPSVIQILDFQSSNSLAHIQFLSCLPGYVENLELCSKIGCYPIFNLPFIVSSTSLSPRYIQWFDSAVTKEVVLEIEGIHFYEFDVIDRSICFENLYSQLSAFKDNGVMFEVDVTSPGLFDALGIGAYATTFELNLSFEVDNYVIVPPLVQFNSRIELLLLETISYIFISHGSRTMMLTVGSNIFELFDNDPFIVLHQSSQSMNVTLITDLIGAQFPLFYEVNYHQSFNINFNQIDYSIEADCINNCEILDQSSILGSYSFTFFIQYFETSFSFELIRQVVLPPDVSISSSLLFSTINDVIVTISVLAKCPLFSEFDLNSFKVSHDQIDYDYQEFVVFPHSYTYSFNISSFNFSLGESLVYWTWNSIGFKTQNVGKIQIFNTDFASTDHVSVFEHRNINVDFKGTLSSHFKCVVHGYSFPGTITDSVLICNGLILPTFEEIVSVYIYFEDFLFGGIVFLPKSHHPRINDSQLSTNISSSFIFDGSRCCNVDVSFCSELLQHSNSVSVDFNSSFDIFKIVITTNSSCRNRDSDLPFQLSVNDLTFSPNIKCTQIASGFSFALVCESNDIIPGVSKIVLNPQNNLFLLELEFYGYESNSCLAPVDINKGITPLGEKLTEVIHLQYGNSVYRSFDQFSDEVSNSSQIVYASHLSYSLFILSPNCFHSKVPFIVTFTPGQPIKLAFTHEYHEIDSNSDVVSIPVLCVDTIGFIVNCSGNVTVLDSSFEWKYFKMESESLVFTLTGFNFTYHHLELQFRGQFVNSTIAFVQKCTKMLMCETFDVIPCNHQMLYDKSCSLLKLHVELLTQHEFSNSSHLISVSNLEYFATENSVEVAAFEDVVELISYPLQSMSITVSYLSLSLIINLVTHDCPFPKLNSGNGCFCPRGMEFNYLGECVECTLNYFSNSEFNSECRPCVFPRLTLQRGSSDLDHCVCPLNTLDSIESCLPCPHLAECGYGNLTAIEPGFRLNTDTWELDECVFWFSCEGNSCRSPYAYGNLCQFCSEPARSTRIFCIGDEHFQIKIVLLITLLLILLLTDVSMSKLLVMEHDNHDILLLTSSRSQKVELIRSMSSFTNFLFMSLFLFSVGYTKYSNSIVVFFEFIISVFKFDISTYFFSVFLFIVISVFSSCVVFNKCKQFKFYHSAFLTTSALVSINFVFAVLHQHFLVSPQSFNDFILVIGHFIIITCVLILQRDRFHFVPLIVYILMMASSFFVLPLHLIVQTILLLLLGVHAVYLDRFVFAVLSAVSVHYVFTVSNFI